MNVEQRRMIEYISCKHPLDVLVFVLYQLEQNNEMSQKRIQETKNKVSDYLLHMYHLQPQYFDFDYNPMMIDGVKPISQLYVDTFNETKKYILPEK